MFGILLGALNLSLYIDGNLEVRFPIDIRLSNYDISTILTIGGDIGSVPS